MSCIDFLTNFKFRPCVLYVLTIMKFCSSGLVCMFSGFSMAALRLCPHVLCMSMFLFDLDPKPILTVHKNTREYLHENEAIEARVQ